MFIVHIIDDSDWIDIPQDIDSEKDQQGVINDVTVCHDDDDGGSDEWADMSSEGEGQWVEITSGEEESDEGEWEEVDDTSDNSGEWVDVSSGDEDIVIVSENEMFDQSGQINDTSSPNRNKSSEDAPHIATPNQDTPSNSDKATPHSNSKCEAGTVKKSKASRIADEVKRVREERAAVIGQTRVCTHTTIYGVTCGCCSF